MPGSKTAERVEPRREDRNGRCRGHNRLQVAGFTQIRYWICQKTARFNAVMWVGRTGSWTIGYQMKDIQC